MPDRRHFFARNAALGTFSNCLGESREDHHAPEDIWTYFCDEGKLEELTPGFLNFKVLQKSTREIGEGTLLDYHLKVNGIPMGWQSRIEDWEPDRRFVDTQVKGPYSYWRHARKTRHTD